MKIGKERRILRVHLVGVHRHDGDVVVLTLDRPGHVHTPRYLMVQSDGTALWHDKLLFDCSPNRADMPPEPVMGGAGIARIASTRCCKLSISVSYEV
jgi:hypothetical protein